MGKGPCEVFSKGTDDSNEEDLFHGEWGSDMMGRESTGDYCI